MTYDIKKASKDSFMNRDQIKDDTPCGCYYCLNTCVGKEVVDFTDEGKTALCPRCFIDALLPGVTDKEVLLAAHENWFCRAREEI